MLNLRRQEQDYTSWSQLQRDVAAVPRYAARRRSSVLRPLYPAVRGWLCRYENTFRSAALLLTAVFCPDFRVPPLCAGEK